MKRYLPAMGTFFVLMALLCASCSGIGSTLTVSNNPKPTPASTPTPLVLPKTAAKNISVVASYYQAIKEKNYTLAYTFVDVHAKNSSGQTLTEASFKQMALASDSENGVIVNVEINPDSDDATQIILTIDRSSSLHYHAHLTMKQEGATWKIISLDRI
jgi:hypothetical protein